MSLTSNVNNYQYTTDSKDSYATREVPNLKVSLMNDNEIKYTMYLDTLKYYWRTYNTQDKKARCSCTTSVVKKQDLNVLLSQKYEKYIIEEENVFRQAGSGDDEIIYLPAQLYNNLSITYSMNAAGDVVDWNICFYNAEKKNNE